MCFVRESNAAMIRWTRKGFSGGALYSFCGAECTKDVFQAVIDGGRCDRNNRIMRKKVGSVTRGGVNAEAGLVC